MKLIFAQGNPEPQYAQTRHNIGMDLLDQFVQEQGSQWHHKTSFFADVAELRLYDEVVLAVKPTTYYNETGRSARKIVDFYKLDTAEDVLVLHDDLMLPFGTIRTRTRGRDAGNNGIKSLNAHLGEHYNRVRIGVWNERRNLQDDTSFVLGRFSRAEQATISDEITPQITTIIDAFARGEFVETTTVIDASQE